MSLPLQGNVAIVTGAARGLGRAYALRLAELGADIVIADINLDGASEYGEKLEHETVMAEVEAKGRQALGFEGNLTDPDVVKRLFDQALKRFGKIDILINNAGGAIARNSGPKGVSGTPNSMVRPAPRWRYSPGVTASSVTK